MNETKIIHLLALIKVELGTSDHLYTLMEELDIDSTRVDTVRDIYVQLGYEE